MEKQEVRQVANTLDQKGEAIMEAQDQKDREY